MWPTRVDPANISSAHGSRDPDFRRYFGRNAAVIDEKTALDCAQTSSFGRVARVLPFPDVVRDRQRVC